MYAAGLSTVYTDDLIFRCVINAVAVYSAVILAACKIVSRPLGICARMLRSLVS